MSLSKPRNRLPKEERGHYLTTLEPKIAYASQELASLAANAMAAKRGIPFNNYHCVVCFWWHVGRQPKPKPGTKWKAKWRSYDLMFLEMGRRVAIDMAAENNNSQLQRRARIAMRFPNKTKRVLP